MFNVNADSRKRNSGSDWIQDQIELRIGLGWIPNWILRIEDWIEDWLEDWIEK